MEEAIADLFEKLNLNDPSWQKHFSQITESSSLESIVWASWLLGLAIAKQLIEQELTRRAQLPTSWTNCTHCCTRLHSKGMRPRQIQTLVGLVHWQRRVGRCPKGCQGSQIAPLDKALGIQSYQQTSLELVKLSCLLAVFVPFETVTIIVHRFTNIELNTQTIWNWVQVWGLHAMTHIQEEMAKLANGLEPTPETISSTLAEMPLVMGADGVMIPMRPHKGKPYGSIQFY